RPGPPPGGIQGYTSEASVAPGERLDIHVAMDPPGRYRLEFYRLGWYDGAGARLLGCIPDCGSDELGRRQSAPRPDPVTGEVRAGWPVTDSFVIPADWLSGYYL